MKTKSENQ